MLICFYDTCKKFKFKCKCTCSWIVMCKINFHEKYWLRNPWYSSLWTKSPNTWHVKYDLICYVLEHLDELQLVYNLHIDAFSFGKAAEIDQDTSMKLIFVAETWMIVNSFGYWNIIHIMPNICFLVASIVDFWFLNCISAFILLLL